MKTIKEKISFKFIRNMLFFNALIVVTFFFIFKDQDIGKIYNIVISANHLYVLIGAFCMSMYFVMEAINIRSILKCFGEKISMLKAVKFVLIGFFFSAITPAATGGQPVEIYFMNKEKISAAKSTMALLIQLCGFQIASLSFALICAILNPTMLGGGFLYMFLLGFIINGGALIAMLIFIFSERLTTKLINFIIKVLKFFRVKNIELKIDRLKSGLVRYTDSSAFIKTHKLEFIKAIGRTFIQVTFYFLVPFFVYKAFGLSELNILQLFSMQAILYTTVSGIPLPGAIGTSEAVFLGMFAIAFSGEMVSGAMLLSRGISFYLFVIISMLVVMVNALRVRNVKSEIDTEVKEFEKELENNCKM